MNSEKALQQITTSIDQQSEKIVRQSQSIKDQALKIRALKGRVRTLTTQRDQANARNQELRAHLEKYQRALSDRGKAAA